MAGYVSIIWIEYMDYWQELVTGKSNVWMTLSLLLPSLSIHWHVNSGVSPFTVPVKFLAVSNAAEMRGDILCWRHAFLRTVVSFIEHESSSNSAGLLVLTAPIEICCDICIKCARFITEMNVILYRQKEKWYKTLYSRVFTYPLAGIFKVLFDEGLQA